MNQSQIAELVEQATSQDNQRPPVEVINKIISAVNAKDSNAQVVSEQLLRRLQLTQLRVIFFALGVLDVLVDRCGMSFHQQVSSQSFFKQLVAMLNNPKMNQEIQNRIAFLIKKWAEKFKDKQNTLPNFTQVYQALVKRGVRFPDMPAGPQGQGQGNSATPNSSKPIANNNSDSKGGQAARSSGGSVPQKFKKLVGDMNLVKGNINFTNEIIDSATPGEKNETLEDLYRTLTQLEPKLISMIAQIDDENVMSTCLVVNDDLHKTFERYRQLKKGKKPAKFVPGESTQQTVLEPSHIYTTQEASSSSNSNNQTENKQGAPEVDLFDLMGASSSQPAAQQQPLPPQQQPQPAAGLPQMDPMMMMQQQMMTNPNPMMTNPNPMMTNQQNPMMMNPMAAQMQQAMAARVQQQMMMNQQMAAQQQQQQPAPQAPPAKQADPNDIVGRLNDVLANMQTHQPQLASQAPPQHQSQNMAMNPFGGYQNPNHNRPTYSTHQDSNPFSGQGPSMESWQRDVNELGFDVNLNVKKRNDNDNVDEFKDLFATGMQKITIQNNEKRGGIDLTYNPGTLPAPAQPAQAAQAQPAMAQPQPMPQMQAQPLAQAAPAQAQPEPSLFSADLPSSMLQQPPSAQAPVLDNDPFAMPPPSMNNVGNVTEQFGAMNFNMPLSSEEEAKSQATIDQIIQQNENRASAVSSVKPAEIDTSGLFNFAGMETNRTEQNITFDAQVQPNVESQQQPPAGNPPAAAPQNAGNDLLDFMQQ